MLNTILGCSETASWKANLAARIPLEKGILGAGKLTVQQVEHRLYVIGILFVLEVTKPKKLMNYQFYIIFKEI